MTLPREEWRPSDCAAGIPLALYVGGKLVARIVSVSAIDHPAGTGWYTVEYLHGPVWEECDERFTEINPAMRRAAEMICSDRAPARTAEKELARLLSAYDRQRQPNPALGSGGQFPPGPLRQGSSSTDRIRDGAGS